MLVGAVTVLVTIVAVFLSYNANTGLPFVPTYDLKANLPNASQLVEGFDVRIGGARVGQVSKIEPMRREDGTTYAQVTLKLDKEIEPLPADSTLLVRPRSSLGLKYLQVVPGTGQAGFKAGATVPIRQARPEVVEIDDFFNMFDDKARVGSRNSLDGYGTGFAGRGRDLNTAIDELQPLLDDLEPVAKNLASPRTRIDRFFKALADTATEVAPVAEEQASMFVNLDTTFTALASIARPFLQESISEGPPSEDVAIREFPKQRPFLRNNAAFFRELRPGVATLPHSAPILGRRLRGRHRDPAQDTPAQRATSPTCSTRWPTSPRTRWCAAAWHSSRGCPPRCARRCASSRRSRPPATTPRCSSATRRACSPRATRTGTGSASRSSRPRRARKSRRSRTSRSTTRSARRAAPPTGPASRTTCTPTPTRTRRRRARPRSARPATSASRRSPSRTIVGNQPGNQGIKTSKNPNVNARR